MICRPIGFDRQMHGCYHGLTLFHQMIYDDFNDYFDEYKNNNFK